MDITKHQITDELAEKGVWREYDGARFLIASNKSKGYTNHVTKASRKLNPQLAKSNPELFVQITMKAMAEKVLLDWEGVNDGETPVPYSKENALMLLETAPDFKDWVADEAGRIENFRAEAVAEDAAAVKSST